MTPTDAHDLLSTTLMLLRVLQRGFHATVDLDALEMAHALLVGVVLRLREDIAKEETASTPRPDHA